VTCINIDGPLAIVNVVLTKSNEPLFPPGTPGVVTNTDDPTNTQDFTSNWRAFDASCTTVYDQFPLQGQVQIHN
jgi:hypothetical protein